MTAAADANEDTRIMLGYDMANRPQPSVSGHIIRQYDMIVRYQSEINK